MFTNRQTLDESLAIEGWSWDTYLTPLIRTGTWASLDADRSPKN